MRMGDMSENIQLQNKLMHDKIAWHMLNSAIFYSSDVEMAAVDMYSNYYEPYNKQTKILSVDLNDLVSMLAHDYCDMDAIRIIEYSAIEAGLEYRDSIPDILCAMSESEGLYVNDRLFGVLIDNIDKRIS